MLGISAISQLPLSTLPSAAEAAWFPLAVNKLAREFADVSSAGASDRRRFPTGLFSQGGVLQVWRRASRLPQLPAIPDTFIERRRNPIIPIPVILNLVPRDPQAPKRTREHLDMVSAILNSLIRQGILVQTGPTDWTIS